MDRDGNGGIAAQEDGDGGLPFALVWSLNASANAYRLCVQNGDADRAAKILPWYAKALIELQFCCPGIKRERKA
jgi:hypothetical protein